MALVAYQNPEFRLDEAERSIHATFRIVNHSHETWRREDGYSLGWQIFDPETATFIAEGEWTSMSKDLAPAETDQVAIEVKLPPEKGRYHVYISPVQESSGWLYARGAPFVLIDAVVEHGRAHLLEAGINTLRSLRRRNVWRSVSKAFTLPVLTITQNWSLI